MSCDFDTKQHAAFTAETDGIHGPFTYIVADSVARNAIAVTAEDASEGRLVLQTNDKSIWKILTTTPTFERVLTSGALVQGSNVTLITNVDGSVTIASSGGGGGSNDAVAVSADDTTPGDLETKLLAGAGIALTTQNGGGNETRTITVDATAAEITEAGHGDVQTAIDAAESRLTALEGASDSDESAKVSANDTTAGYLNGKLVAGSGITLTENNDGSNETLTITATGGSGSDENVKVSANDTTASFLGNKIVAGTGIAIAEQNDGSDEDLQISCDITANEITYDNSGSGLSSTDVDAALDELYSDIQTVDTLLDGHIVDATDAHDASAISYVNTTSGLTATNAQTAIDEIEGRVDTLEAADPGISGDVSGTLSATVVDRIKGVPVSGTAPSNAQLMVYDGASSSAWEPQTLQGDVALAHSGSVLTATVEAIQGQDVETGTPANGDVLTWNTANSRWQHEAPSGGGGAQLVCVGWEGEIDCITGSWYGQNASAFAGENGDLSQTYGAANAATSIVNPSSVNNGRVGIPVPCAGTIKGVTLFFDNFTNANGGELYIAAGSVTHDHGGTTAAKTPKLFLDPQICLDAATDGLGGGNETFSCSTYATGPGRTLTLETDTDADVEVGDSLHVWFATDYSTNESVSGDVYVQFLIEKS